MFKMSVLFVLNSNRQLFIKCSVKFTASYLSYFHYSDKINPKATIDTEILLKNNLYSKNGNRKQFVTIYVM